MVDLNADVLVVLTMVELKAAIAGCLLVPRAEKDRKNRIMVYIVANADVQLKEDLLEQCSDKASLQHDIQRTRKRKRVLAARTLRREQRLRYIETQDHRDPHRYMDLPSELELRDCFSAFIDATSNSAVKHVICAICAREVNQIDADIQCIPITDLPNAHRLIPRRSHPAHDLYDEDILLEPQGVITTDDGTTHSLNVCSDCMKSLKSSNEAPPSLSLANNLWIGRVPWELQVLTVPEQLLIALVYPRVFVFKLYPKDKDFRPNQASLQSGMRGNVSTFEQDIEGIAHMVDGRLMPRRMEILSSIITVTYIGKGTLAKHSLHSTFRVRRGAIRAALHWLKVNNTRYYGHIQIDEETLRTIPEDDVPDEIVNVIRQNMDGGLVDEENGGYVPDDNSGAPNGEQANPTPDVPANDDTSVEDEDDPDVIPLQVSGSVDTDLTKMSSSELMMWGLANLWKDGGEGGYSVRHGRQPVRDFAPRTAVDATDTDDDQPPSLNYFERAFPCLFPYGCGGIEAECIVPLDFSTHVKWALQYHDRRFRKHQTFPFVAFGIKQKRQALSHACIQMSRRDFERDAPLMSSLTVERLEKARLQEEKGLPITDPIVLLLRKHVHATTGRVVGTDHSRFRLRSKIRATSIAHGPPAIWNTINPNDANDPLAQVFTGAQIDLDNFVATMGPDRDQRARNIASDPYGAAKFFHFMINTILETLMQVKVSKFQVKSGPGIFGEVAAYFGTVESQGRGTLYLHMLIWLKNAPTAEELAELLKTEEFRQKMTKFIKANVRAYCPGLETSESIKAIPSDQSIGADVQVHTCKIRRCLVPNKNGLLVCKRKAPWATAMEDFVKESGEWGPQRMYGFVNGYCPPILLYARCNNDCKLLTNGRETKNISWYVTGYAAKKQGRQHNSSAILAQGYAYHVKHHRADYVDELRDRQCLLIFHLVHAINKEQELSAPMVMSYLMGWGDVYRSHKYTSVFWSSFVRALVKAFPDIQKPTNSESMQHSEVVEDHLPSRSEDNEQIDVEQRDTQEGEDADNESGNREINEDSDDMITLEINTDGRLHMKSQVVDYQFRGPELNTYNVHKFFTDTYETAVSTHPPYPQASRPGASSSAHVDDEIMHSEDEEPDRHCAGRESNVRARYQPPHPCAGSKQRVVRTPLHRNIINYAGRFFPSRHDPTTYPFYCALLLLLLKPWRNLSTDLKAAEQSWEEAFEIFERNASDGIHRTISGIQYFHDCRTAAQDRANNDLPLDDSDEPRTGDIILGIDDMEIGEDVVEPDRLITEEVIARVMQAQVPPGELQHAKHAVEIAKGAKLFRDNNLEWKVPQGDVLNAVGGDLAQLAKWKEQMNRDVQRVNGEAIVPSTHSNETADVGSVEQTTSEAIETAADVQINAPIHSGEGTLSAANPAELKDEQFRAFDIIRWHLSETIAGNNPPPLRMLLYGEGGTGKSKVIQTITEEFTFRGVDSMLAKAAYTGVAASLIDGKTTHTVAALSVKESESQGVTDEAKAKLQTFWKTKRYLIVDKFSMLGKTHVERMERHIAIGKVGGEGRQEGTTWGGINIIFCGDLHQFPPVAQGKAEFLFHPQYGSLTGRRLYEEFTTVVVLREQCG
ncbi:hypothetical protein EW026_g7647 [Hermanssonia centrifuga]|uniref:ATP-dependent DNA helicase n=1 Tax=Hermanssonia centrifuga TaxID=98765 RepID=A0A4S4K737_9APHY|nr:hypothetical protein EW026_g7647 [Hermanssonia centrifuga]